jgi:hypothetical protein
MLIWRGYGYWIVLLPVLLTIIFEFNLLKDLKELLYSLLISGYLIIGYFGYKLNKNSIHKYKNNKTGEIFEVEEKHDFFYIPMQYASIICIVIIVFSFIQK